MAIYPVQSNYIVDVDIITTTSFKAGMALIRDDNGRAIPADSQQLISKTVQQKSGKFLGFAASDHDSSGFTIIEPDVISASWLDNNKNFQRFENVEVVHARRAIAEHLDPNYTLDNPTYRPTIYKRGIGVYNQQGEIYITDQFVPVLHGDYGIDSSTIVTINPGDILTFGGGINAGKLVKVNADSFGPDVLVVAIAEKYISETGLLHFRQVNYGISFGTSPYILALDAGNSLSYIPNSTSVTNLALRTFTGTLINGASYSSLNTGSWSFDGTDDAIDFTGNTLVISNDNFSFEFVAKPNATIIPSAEANSGIAGVFDKRYILEPTMEGSNGGFGIALGTNAIECVEHGGSYLPVLLSYSTNLSGVNHFCVVVNNKTSKLYINGVYIKDGLQSPKPNSVYKNTASLGNGFYGKYSGLLYKFSSYNRVLSATEVLNLYNFNKSRYGL